MCKKFIHFLPFVFLIFCLPAFLFAHPDLTTSRQNVPAKLSFNFFGSITPITQTNNYKTAYLLAIDVTPQPITICSAASIVIRGDVETVTPDSYAWEVLQGSVWLNAPGINTSADYPPLLLINNTNANILFSIRRRYVTAGVTSYDSYYNVTVLPSSPVINNIINTPAVNSYCSPGSPATITGSTPSGGDGNITYQWQSSADNVNFANIIGATASTYTPPSLTSTTYYRRTVNAGSCVAPSLSNTIGIVIFQQVGNNVITAPAVSAFCIASDPVAIVGNTPAGGDGTYTYQWQVSTDNSNFTDISGATAQNYDPATISVTTYYRRSAKSGVCSTPVYSNSVAITIYPPLGNNTLSAPAVTSFCVSGDAANIAGSSPIGGNNVFTYQWQQSIDNVNFTDIPAATAKDFDPPFLTTTTYYRRVVSSAPCATPLLSNVITINLLPLPGVPVLSQTSVTVCPGSTATLSISGPQAGFTYNWYDSATKTTLLFTGATYITPAQTVNKTFYVEASNGTCASSALAPVNVVILQPVINSVITASGVIAFCSASDPAAIIGNIPTGGDGTYVYQWQQSTDNVNFTDINGATAQDYDPTTISVTTYYRRSAKSGGCTVPGFSNSVAITILPVLAGNTLTAPAVTSFCVSGDATNITGSLPAGGNNTYTYQWQQSTDNVNFIDIPGVTTRDFDPPLLTVSTYYRRVVSSSSCAAPLTSNVIAVNLLPIPVAPVLSVASVTVCPGSTATLSVSGPQTGLTYNWYDSAAKTTLLFTGVTYITPAQTVNKTFYVESSNGSCSSPSLASVNVVILTPVANSIITAPGVSAFCSASDPTAIIGNIPTGGDGTYVYQWQQSTDNVNFTDINGATTQNYDPATISVTTYYRRSAKSGGCTVPVFSNSVAISILPVLAGNTLTAPAVTSFCVSGDATNITGSLPAGGNNTYTYQWQQSTDNVNFIDIPGVTTKDFDPPLLTVSTYYRRVVSSSSCAAPLTSNVIAVNLLPIPVAPVLSLTSVTVCPGSTATLSVSSPQAGFTYNWYDSATKTTLLFTGTSYTTPAQTVNKTFYVESSNGTCSSSSLASVQVNIAAPPTAPALVNSSVSTCNGSSVTLSISGAQAGFTYNWYSAVSGGTVIYSGVNYTTPVLSANAVYYVEAMNPGGCTSISRAAVNVNINALPQVTVQGSSACAGTTAILTASADVGNSTLNWYTNANGGSIVYSGNTFTTPALSSDITYYVEAVNNVTGCVSATRKPVVATLLQPLSAPVVKAGVSTVSSVTFNWDAVTGATAYQVSTDGTAYGDPSSGSTGLSHTVTGLRQSQAVSIMVRAMGSSGCQLSANSLAVTAKAENEGDDIFVANAFTPNGDGKNDIVYVHSEGIKSMNFYVYDQWGEMIFSSLDIANGWDGTYKGAKEPAGVYIYYVKAIMNNGHSINKKGTITLLR